VVTAALTHLKLATYCIQSVTSYCSTNAPMYLLQSIAKDFQF